MFLDGDDWIFCLKVLSGESRHADRVGDTSAEDRSNESGVRSTEHCARDRTDGPKGVACYRVYYTSNEKTNVVLLLR